MILFLYLVEYFINYALNIFTSLMQIISRDEERDRWRNEREVILSLFGGGERGMICLSFSHRQVYFKVRGLNTAVSGIVTCSSTLHL